MEKLIELETKKLVLLDQIKQCEINQQERNSQLLELRYMTKEINNYYSSFYNDNPFCFIETYKRLDENYHQDTYINILSKSEEELIAYTIYQQIQQIIYRGPKYQRENMVKSQLANVYITYFEQIRKSLPAEIVTDLKYKLCYINSSIADYLLYKEPMQPLPLEGRMAADYLRTIECRKIQKRMVTHDIDLKTKIFQNKSIKVLMNHLINPEQAKALQEELNRIANTPLEQPKQNIITFPNYYKKSTSLK